MKMKSYFLFLLPVVPLVVTAQLVPEPESSGNLTWKPRTAGAHELNLRGMMFTLSLNKGGVYFFPPSPQTTTPPPTTTLRPSWTTAPPTTTTAPPPAGLSVCFRYTTDQRGFQMFRLSGSGSSLKMFLLDQNSYSLTFNHDEVITLRPNLWFLDPRSNIWTSACVAVDTVVNVVQMFSSSRMSIRKLLSRQFVWSGDPLMDFPGFDGQLTDVQVWNSLLNYEDVRNYLGGGAYRTYRGSALTWFDIRYTVRGNALLEESYEFQENQPIRRGGGKKPRKCFDMRKRTNPDRQLA